MVTPERDSPRTALARASYADAVCWLGACLADGLQYAHERGLVHLDLKPSNILLSADGQPLLLDFHLARGPVRPDADLPWWLGGTPGYMSPEQHAALKAVGQGRKTTLLVDGRSDVYSLGVVLYEALSGKSPEPGERAVPLNRQNPQVSVGLADVITKCLEGSAQERYSTMANLAADLRRHLAHRPLKHVRNRSVAERWRKWRRRRPHGAPAAVASVAVLLATAAAVTAAATDILFRREQIQISLEEGQVQATHARWDDAIRTFQRGLHSCRDLPFERHLTTEFDRRLDDVRLARSTARRGLVAGQLRRLADQVRFLYGREHPANDELPAVERSCQNIWQDREWIAYWFESGSHCQVVVDTSKTGTIPQLPPSVREDLVDVAIFWADCQSGSPGRGVAILRQAETLLGPCPVTAAERQRHGEPVQVLAGCRRSTDWAAWDHYALGRCYLTTGKFAQAAHELHKAIYLEPHGLWSNFYEAQCAYRQGRYLDAVAAWSICIGAAPEAAFCWYGRAVAFARLGNSVAARQDYDRAVQLDAAFVARPPGALVSSHLTPNEKHR